MGKTFTRMVKASSVAWDELDKKINKTLEELGNPKVICVEVFETDFFEGLCALLVLEERQ